MKLSRLWTFGCLFLLTLTQQARAQQFVPLAADGSGATFSMMPLAGADGLSTPLFAGSTIVSSSASVGGRTTNAIGELEIGFDYIRPFWSSRDFTLVVPAVNAGSFPLLGDIGHVDDHFALSPHVNMKYDVTREFAIKASGTFMSLTGHLDRTLSPTDSEGTLTATSSLTIVTATFPEIVTRFYWDDFFPSGSHGSSHFDELTMDLGFGTRYGSIDQNYTGTLTNTAPAGKNESQRHSTQSFKGIGITSSLNFLLPVHDNWSLFTNTRGSVLVGDNNKESALSVTLSGMPGQASSIKQSKTEFIPVGEIETGVVWIHDFREVTITGQPRASIYVRAGFTGQVWGEVGPLSAGSTQGFQSSHLFLVGGHIMIGLVH